MNNVKLEIAKDLIGAAMTASGTGFMYAGKDVVEQELKKVKMNGKKSIKTIFNACLGTLGVCAGATTAVFGTLLIFSTVKQN